MRLFFLIIGLMVSFCTYSQGQNEVALARQARSFLSKQDVGRKCHIVKAEGKKTKKVCVSLLQSLDVVLAVKRDEDKEFHIVEAVGNGPKMCFSKTTGFSTMCYVLPNGKRNGIATHFEVSSPKGYKVYAIRGVVNSPNGRREVVYTPLSTPLNVASVQRVGDSYISWVIKRAYNELRKLRVHSLSNPTELVSDHVPADLIHKLAIIEHIDESRFMNENFHSLVKEVQAVYGLNMEHAYNYAVSSAGARSMFQIIPKTYFAIAAKYPEAKIKKDFVQGTTNHVNAAKVAILLADHDVGLVNSKDRKKLFADLRKYEEYVASSYNGGPSRSKRILANGGDFVSSNTNKENRIYVSKLRAMK